MVLSNNDSLSNSFQFRSVFDKKGEEISVLQLIFTSYKNK